MNEFDVKDSTGHDASEAGKPIVVFHTHLQVPASVGLVDLGFKTHQM